MSATTTLQGFALCFINSSIVIGHTIQVNPRMLRRQKTALSERIADAHLFSSLPISTISHPRHLPITSNYWSLACLPYIDIRCPCLYNEAYTL